MPNRRVGEDDPTQANLDVYEGKPGLGNPDHSDLKLPADSEFLPSGDEFVTRQVKAAGTFWTAWQPRTRTAHTVCWHLGFGGANWAGSVRRIPENHHESPNRVIRMGTREG